MSWKVLDIQVSGTIAAPKDREACPGVIFLAGSGPTDRNWCSPLLPGLNGTAKILAEKLARRGYVTLRYDKLGSGPHAKENLPKFSGRVVMETFREELSGAVETIVSEKNVDSSNLFSLTNSEGAIHAVNYQLQAGNHQFKGLLLTGAPGRAIGEVARTQIMNQAKSLPNAEILIKHYDEAIADFLSGRPIVIDPSLPKVLEPYFHSLESPSNLPFSRELWIYNLPEYITKLKDPILIVIGKKDIQVDWEIDGQALEKATQANPRAKLVYPENANHLLKHEEMPKEKLTPQYVGSQYNAQDAELDNEAANAIFEWLDTECSRSESIH